MDSPPSVKAPQTNGRPDASTDLNDRLTLIRRHLHMYPETGMQEVETSRFIRETLEREGFTVHGPVAQTGLYVDIEGAHPGPAIAYRADMDALPIQDVKDVPYASRNVGVAHLCGHDAHAAVGIGVALTLQERRDELHGRVRVFFQPNEEGMPSGAPLMIQDGILDGISAAYCIHVDPTRPVGTFGLAYGAVTAANDSFIVELRSGGTGHAARPHETVDLIWVATQIMNTLYQLTGRIQDVRNSAVLTIGRFFAGSALNVIPDQIEFGGTLRCIDETDRRLLREQMKKTVCRIAGLYGADAEFHLLEGAPSVVNDPGLAHLIEETATGLFGHESVQTILRPSMGAEDFAHYLQAIPGALVRVGTAAGPETRYPLHHTRFDLSEDALGLATRLMSETLINHLLRHSRAQPSPA